MRANARGHALSPSDPRTAITMNSLSLPYGPVGGTVHLGVLPVLRKLGWTAAASFECGGRRRAGARLSGLRLHLHPSPSGAGFT